MSKNGINKNTTSQENVTPRALHQDNGAKKFPKMGGFLRRYAAVFIDKLVVGFLSGIVAVTLAGIVGISFRSMDAFGVALYVFIILSSLVLGVVYYGYFYSKKGQTPGKKLLKLKVVDARTLNYIDFWKAALRDTIGKFISGLLFSLGYLWYFMSEKRQAWHDSIFDTIVVATDDDGNILMTGSEKYQKEPIKTFLPCGCTSLLIIGLITALILLGISTSADNFKPTYKYNGVSNTNVQYNSPFVK